MLQMCERALGSIDNLLTDAEYTVICATIKALTTPTLPVNVCPREHSFPIYGIL